MQKIKNQENPLRIVIRYSNQHNEIRRIVNKCWQILTMDPIIGHLVPNAPMFTFRRATSIRDKLVRSEFRDESAKDHCKYKGTFICGSCRYCKYMHTAKRITLPNGDPFRPKHFANCKMLGVIYMLLCDCGCFYIGKTMLQFWQRAYRHIRLQTCNLDLPLGRHTSLVHNGNFPKM